MRNKGKRRKKQVNRYKEENEEGKRSIQSRRERKR
jgi:hypothetical protein